MVCIFYQFKTYSIQPKLSFLFLLLLLDKFCLMLGYTGMCLYFILFELNILKYLNYWKFILVDAVMNNINFVFLYTSGFYGIFIQESIHLYWFKIPAFLQTKVF